VKVHLFNRQKDLAINSLLTKKAVAFFLKKQRVKSIEVALYFIEKKEIQRLHGKYFKDPSSTDCLSFPLDSPKKPGFLGEVFICPQVAIEYAEKNALNPYDETLLYVVHALLHLIGFKDSPQKEKILMQKKEKEGMKLLKTNLLGLSKVQLKTWQ